MKIQCDVCSREEASVFCTADEAALCGGCDRRVHHANKLAGKHVRFSLQRPPASSKESPRCDICQEKRAILFCQEDRAILCRDCDVPIHRTNEHTHKHNRFLLTGVILSSASYSSSSSNGCGFATDFETKSSVSTDHTNNKATLPSTSRNCGAGIDHCTSQGNWVSPTSNTSSISEYLMETLPGWCVDDFLDPPCSPPTGFCKIMDHDIEDDLYPPLEDKAIWVPQAPGQSSHIPVYLPQTGVFNGLLQGSEKPQDVKINRKCYEDRFTVPQISPPLKKSRIFL